MIAEVEGAQAITQRQVELIRRQVTDVTEAAKMLAAPGAVPDPELGPLRALRGVHDFPGRLQCANLAWDALHAALQASALPEPLAASAGKAS